MRIAEVLAHIKERRKRRKAVYVGEEWLRKALRMPEDVFIERIDYDMMRQSFVIICSNMNWPEVPDYAEPPVASGTLSPVWVKGKHFGLEDADEDIIMMDLHIDWGSDDIHDQ